MNGLDKIKAEAVADAHFIFALNLHHRLADPTPDFDEMFTEKQMAEFVIDLAWKQRNGRAIIDLALGDLTYPMNMRYRGLPAEVTSNAISEVRLLADQLKP
jgi:hypothetical protein